MYENVKNRNGYRELDLSGSLRRYVNPTVKFDLFKYLNYVG